MLVLEYVFKPYLIDIRKDDNLNSVFSTTRAPLQATVFMCSPRTSEDRVLSVGGRRHQGEVARERHVANAGGVGVGIGAFRLPTVMQMHQQQQQAVRRSASAAVAPRGLVLLCFAFRLPCIRGVHRLPRPPPPSPPTTPPAPPSGRASLVPSVNAPAQPHLQAQLQLQLQQPQPTTQSSPLPPLAPPTWRSRAGSLTASTPTRAGPYVNPCIHLHLSPPPPPTRKRHPKWHPQWSSERRFTRRRRWRGGQARACATRLTSTLRT